MENKTRWNPAFRRPQSGALFWRSGLAGGLPILYEWLTALIELVEHSSQSSEDDEGNIWDPTDVIELPELRQAQRNQSGLDPLFDFEFQEEDGWLRPQWSEILARFPGFASRIRMIRSRTGYYDQSETFSSYMKQRQIAPKARSVQGMPDYDRIDPGSSNPLEAEASTSYDASEVEAEEEYIMERHPMPSVEPAGREEKSSQYGRRAAVFAIFEEIVFYDNEFDPSTEIPRLEAVNTRLLAYGQPPASQAEIRKAYTAWVDKLIDLEP